MNLTSVPKLADLLEHPERVPALPVEAVPALLGDLERLKATLWARLTLPQSNGQAQGDGDRLLDAKQSAGHLGMSVDYVYKHASEFPFAVKEGRCAGWRHPQGLGDSLQERQSGREKFHDFRRTAVRNMVEAGVSEKVAMEILGHKTRAMFDRYHIVARKDRREAMVKTQRYLKSLPIKQPVVSTPEAATEGVQ